MESAAFVLMIGKIYVWIGVAVAALFLTIGVGRVDPKTHGSWIFRPLLIPGVILIWPLVLWRWWILEKAVDNLQNRHRPPLNRQRLWGYALVLAIPVIVIGGLILRQNGPYERPAVMLQAASEESTGE